MSTKPLFTLSASPDVSRTDLERLLIALRTIVEVQETARRSFGPTEWATFVAIIKGIGVVATSASAILKLSKELADWKTKQTKHNRSAVVRLSRPRSSDLNLEAATSKEIEAWLSEHTE